MTCEQKVLLHILNAAINDKEIDMSDDFNNVDWNMLFKESLQHSVALQCFDKLSSIKHIIPKDVYDNWKSISYNLLLRNSLVNNDQNEVVEILEKNNISYVIIKGEASSQYYNKPELRSQGDIDLLINKADKDKVKTILLNNNYTSSKEGDKCHTIYKRGRALIEVHHKPAGIPDNKIGKIIENHLENIAENFVRVSNSYGAFKIFNDYYHAIIILLHIQHHLTGGGIGLRHIVDWAFFLSKTHKDEFWEKELIPFFKSVGLWNFAVIITGICEKYFGVPTPYQIEIDETTVSLILEDILLSGNFGAKDHMRSKSSMMISKTENTDNNMYHNLFVVFKNSIYEHHTVVRKYKFLYPIFFVFRFFRYFLLVIFKKRILFTKAIPQAETRIELYKRLRLFEVEIND